MKEEETCNGSFPAIEETASRKKQGLLLKAEKLATREPAPFHHSPRNYISRFTLCRLVGHLFLLGERTFTKVSGKKEQLAYGSDLPVAPCPTCAPGEAIERRCSFFFIRAFNSFLLQEVKSTDSLTLPLGFLAPSLLYPP